MRILLFVALFVSATSFGQAKHKFGIKGGFGNTNYSYSYLGSYLIGGTYSIRLKNSLYLGTGIGFESRKASPPSYYLYGNTIRDKYLNIPIYIKPYFGKSNLVFLKTGAYLNYHYKSTSTSLTYKTENAFGLLFGGGLAYNIEKLEFSLGVDLNIDINQTRIYGDELFNKAGYAYLGISYCLGSKGNSPETTENKIHHSKNSIYLELWGHGPVYSLNYERELKRWTESYLSVSGGFGYFNQGEGDDRIISVPVKAIYGYGLNVHSVEISTGISYNSGPGESVYHYNSYTTPPQYRNRVFSVSGFYYKRQKHETGFFMKTGINLLIAFYDNSTVYNTPNHKVLSTIGFALGYSF